MAPERGKKNAATKNIRNKQLVNTTTPYEQLIAAKLEQVPVPDMADSIWAGIEMQLDAPVEVPAQQAKQAKKPSFKFKGKIWYGVIGVTVVAALLWWHHSRKQHTPGRAKPAQTVPVIQPPADSSTFTDSAAPQKPAIAPVHAPKKDTLPSTDTQGVPRLDTVLQPVLPPLSIIKDSLPVPGRKILLPKPDSVIIQPGKKKDKGVPGITDDDYKISGKKDTDTRRN